ncbi:MAG: MOSC domain-containing protein, partial [Boseongicola sp.]|nr:MOSC domain-containing protein [Boseongicola sp.]
MTGSISMIVRHPIKSIGRETLDGVSLQPGAWLPHDRKWAVAHERSKLDGGWGKKVNFLRGVADPELMAITSSLDSETKDITLTHPKIGSVEARLGDKEGAAKIVDWLRKIWPDDLPKPTEVYKTTDAHLTDVPDPWISINSTASLKALSQRAGSTLSPHRFRGNLWVDGLSAWEEHEWVGKTLKVGSATLQVREQITRCKATM